MAEPERTEKKNGGKRPGAGMPKGYKTRKTLLKEAQREVLRQQVFAEQDAMTQAQIAAAKGIQHFVLRGADGKFKKVESAEAAVLALNDPESVFEFWTRDPSIQAFTDLMNRALDKPKEQEQDINLRGTLNIADILRQRQQRHRSNS